METEQFNTVLGKIASYSLGKIKTKEVTSKKGVTSRTISGLANAYVEDRGKEIVDPAAFKSSLDAYLTKNPIVFYNHEWDEPIGTVKAAKISGAGLYVEIEIGTGFEPADTVWTQITQGILRSFSIGFRPIVVEYNEDTDVLLIKDLELYEISVVTIPMNTDSLFEMGEMGLTGIKCFSNKDLITYKSLITKKENSITDSQYTKNEVNSSTFEFSPEDTADTPLMPLDTLTNWVVILKAKLDELEEQNTTLMENITELKDQLAGRELTIINLQKDLANLRKQSISDKLSKMIEDSGITHYIRNTML